MNEKGHTPSIRLLYYRKGDLIIKQGDYGISIYRILKGHIQIYNESGHEDIPRAVLKAGDILGEMIFWTMTTEVRTASARAIEDTEVEVWHPSRISKTYEQMPEIFRFIAKQTHERLTRMNKLLHQLRAKIIQKEDLSMVEQRAASQRLFYRRDVNQECQYRPAGTTTKGFLIGRIKDISLGGVGLEVRMKNVHSFPHEPGKEFYVMTVLPNNQKIDFVAKVTTFSKDSIPGKILLGLSFTKLSDESGKRLGFFMMPA